MTSPAVTKKARPMSPHLQVYRPQMTSVLSIFHRLTGVGLACGLPVFVLWLVALASGEQFYNQYIAYAHSYVGYALLMGWTWAFAYHLCMGVRHLLWDMGLCLEIKQAYKTAYVALVVSTLLTVGIWFKLVWA